METSLEKLNKLNLKYVKEAVKEPVNFWGLAGFAVAAAYTQSVIPLAVGLVAEGAYLVSVPAMHVYKKLVDRRAKERMYKLREVQRERLINTFSQREREAVLYLQNQKNQVYENYKKFTGASELPTNLRTLEQRWEDFVDLLDTYRRRKQHLKNINRQVIHNQLSQAYRTAEAATDDRTKRIQNANVEILKRRLGSYDELEKSVKLVEGQLQSIENFFGLVNDQIVSLPTPERVSSLNFEQLSDSIDMTRQMLEATADAMGTLDSHNREMGNYDLLANNPK
jgi:methyl-accepting chemotaxis protein